MSEMRKIFRELITVNEAIDLIMKSFDLTPKRTEEVPLFDAVERVLARDISSSIDVPPFDRSIVDGYAVSATDTFKASEINPVKLKVIDRVRTGSIPKKRVLRNTAIELDTGSMIPAGADAVVPVEFTEEEDGFVKIYKRVSPGANIQYAGSDISRGEIILRIGYRLEPRDIGVLAALGINKVTVYAKPRVAIFSIGDELVTPGEKLTKLAVIYDVNSYTLYTSVIQSGGKPIFLGIARDREEDVRRKIIEAVNKADIIISSGSSSTGYSDMIYRIIDSIGESRIIVHGIKSKPGKPVLIASINSKPYFGLPGFPTSCLIAFRNFVKPVIMLMAGYDPSIVLKELLVELKRKVRGEKGRRLFKTISLKKVDNDIVGVPLPAISGAITTLANAEGYFEISENVEYLSSGERVVVKLFEDVLKLPELILGGILVPTIDKAISKYVRSKRNNRIKYLKMNNLAALNALLTGEIDIAILSFMSRKENASYKDLLNSNKLYVLASLERDIALVTRLSSNVNSFEEAIENKLMLANREKGSSIREVIDSLLINYAEKKNIDVEKLKREIPGYYSEYKTTSSTILAVLGGKADYTLAPLDQAKMYEVKYRVIVKEKVLLVTKERIKRSRNIKEFIKILLSPSET